jgi:site-specific DNA recombinase
MSVKPSKELLRRIGERRAPEKTRKMTGHTAVLYARVSSREQKEEGYSIEAQVRLLREAALNKGFEVLREFIEIESAKTAGRKVFDEMVTFLKRNRSCRTLLVEKTDRLYRNQRDALTISDLDIEVHFVKEGEILSKDAKSQVKFISDIRLAMARNYSENLREEVKKGMLEKCLQGTIPAMLPLATGTTRPHAQSKFILTTPS